MRSLRFALVTLALVVVFSTDVEAAGSNPYEATGAQRAGDPLEEHITLLVTLGKQALNEPRLAEPMPCLAHWLAGSDNIAVAVSAPGNAAGLEPGDVLQRIGGRELTGTTGGVWTGAVRALPAGLDRYSVEVMRDGTVVPLALPCASDRAVRLHHAERGLWTAITRRDWTSCLERGREMIDAFGVEFSPPLMLMTQCAAVAGAPDPGLTHALAQALLAEIVSHPEPQPDLREQLFLALRELELTGPPGGEDYARGLREDMVRAGVQPPARRD